jgi:hypothetical protein
LGSKESLIGVIIGVTGRDAFARTVGETGGDPMNPRIKPTVVGSYPVPPWLVGNTSRLVLRDAVMSVLKTQELAGLDLISDGELIRFDPSHPETKVLCFGDGVRERDFFTALAGASRPEVMAGSAVSRG